MYVASWCRRGEGTAGCRLAGPRGSAVRALDLVQADDMCRPWNAQVLEAMRRDPRPGCAAGSAGGVPGAAERPRPPAQRGAGRRAAGGTHGGSAARPARARVRSHGGRERDTQPPVHRRVPHGAGIRDRRARSSVADGRTSPQRGRCLYGTLACPARSAAPRIARGDHSRGHHARRVNARRHRSPVQVARRPPLPAVQRCGILPRPRPGSPRFARGCGRSISPAPTMVLYTG